MARDTEADKPDKPAPKRKGLALSTKILLGLILGTAAGLFFGEYVAWLKPLGTAFVGLLQMTVLPYLMVALIANLGRLDFESSKRLLLKGCVVLLVLWGLACLAVVVTPFAMPAVESGSFFSTADLTEQKPFDLLGLFVPFNIFESLSSNLVPGVVVFCIFLGLALMTMEKKQSFIDLLDVVGAALLRVNGMVVKLMPVGTFAIAGGAAGTMSLEEFAKLEGYILVTVAAVAILTFFVVPMLIAAVTPFGYRRIMKMCGASLVTAFATSKVIVVFPLLIEETNKLFKEIGAPAEETTPRIDVLYPLAYPFPHLGKLMGLLFIPFAGWFAGSPLEAGQMPLLLGGGVLSYFGGPILATPFLLDEMHLPSDLMQLFLASGVLTARLGDLLGVMHFVAIAVITTCAVTGLLRFNKTTMLKLLIGTAGLMLLAVVLIRARLGAVAATAEDMSQILADMQSMNTEAEREVLKAAGPNPVPLDGRRVGQRIRATSTLRVGYNADRLPFCYFNTEGELVGFDVELIDHLAADFELRVVFVPYEFDTLEKQLDEDHFDLAIGGFVANSQRVETMRMSAPYLDAHIGIVVRDHMRQEYGTLREFQEMDDLKVAYVDPTYERGLRRVVPNATIVRIASPKVFFEKRDLSIDAFAETAEVGFAWTILHPEFHVAFPLGRRVARPLVFPIRDDCDAFKESIDAWIDIAKLDLTIQELYDYWILGKSARKKGPRWSIIRDVLGWVD